jgi:23S rRNA C2498 (ribose-2'-O)-methylase RlmM
MFYPTKMERLMHDELLGHVVHECQEYEKSDSAQMSFSKEQLIFAVVALALRVKLLKQTVHNEKRDLESTESVLSFMTHEQLVRRCASLSEALNAENLDSDAGKARMLLERVLAELKPLRAKNVRLVRDIEAFLLGLT